MKRLILIALLATGCVTVTAPAAPTNAPTSTVSATPAPTATPTPRPTPRPTPTVSVTTTPKPPSLGFPIFVFEAIEWIDTINAGITEIGDTADRGRIPPLRTAVADALADARDIETWLWSNPPDDDCYADLHDGWTEYIETFVDGLDLIDYGLSEPITWDDVQDGIDRLRDATRLLDDLTTTMERTVCN